MNVKDVLHGSLDRSKLVTEALLADLSDAELLERPVPQANHVAWQLGHMVASFHFFGETVQPGSMPKLPEGFAERYNNEASGTNDPSAFLSKAEYLRLLEQQRQALAGVIAALPESRLEDDAPEPMRSYAPKIVDVLGMVAAHELMHAGQFTVVRRRLGKPVAF
jgi:uncharacterized damage-inducible protein DinB